MYMQIYCVIRMFVMKLKKIKYVISAVFLAAVLSLFSTATAFAMNDDDDPDVPVYESVEPVYTEPEPETDPEPQTDPEPETDPEPQTEPQTETEPQPETDPQPQTEPQTENNGGGNVIEDNTNNKPTEFFEPPTLPKTVSKKTYSTNYTAGIVSWICVGVGLVVVLVVLISTKVSGRRKISGL